MKRILAAALLLSMVGVARADLVEEEPVMKDNTGPLSGGSEAADIVSGGDEKVKGTKEGEITLERTETGVKVYSGMNEVENIDRGSDGWVGKMDVQDGHIYFTPAGRPQLDCPKQSLASWYGPCKVRE